MVSISAYLAMERFDTSQPVSFFAPGAKSWDENHFRGRRRALDAVDVDPPDESEQIDTSRFSLTVEE